MEHRPLDGCGPTIDDLIAMRMSRRGMLATAAVAAGGMLTAASMPAGAATEPSFREVPRGVDVAPAAPPGYRMQVVVAWGDPLLPGAPPLDVNGQSAAAQLRQFGYNNDFIGFIPLPFGSSRSDHGLLCVNHEYTNPELMFPGITPQSKLSQLTREQVEIEMAAHGHSVVEIKKVGRRWEVVRGRWNRRISALDTVMAIRGPAAGHPRMQTAEDPTGRRVVGTINDCGGGITPWGTVLIGEENFHLYFGGDPASGPEAENHRRYGISPSTTEYAWWRFYDRFDVAKEPHSPNRFGWIVEFDPLDPKSMPVKRTALGRLSHEAAAVALTPDDRLVVYSGDDARFEYFYRFVSRRRVDRKNRQANRDLLDDGTLYVARFYDDGRLEWLPLVFGHGPLTPENGFHSQADVLIETRRAADLLGATPMDRPEDAEVNPVTGHLFLILTNNTSRTHQQLSAANPRPANKHGHILELVPPRRGDRLDHGADEFRWEIFLLAGDPRRPEDQSKYHPQVSNHGWLSCPDNCAFDNQGRIWIATDGAEKAAGMSDGLYVCDTQGPARALTRHFFRGPTGSEICGPCFTPDERTLFVAVQHPGEGPGLDGRPSTFAEPSTRWPDFRPDMPPRPAVVAIMREDGRVIGS